MKQRTEVNTRETWDLSDLFESKEAFLNTLNDVKKESELFKKDYEGNMGSLEVLAEAFDTYAALKTHLVQLGTYVTLNSDVDKTNLEAQQLRAQYMHAYSEINTNTTFFMTDLRHMDPEFLEAFAAFRPDYDVTIDTIIREQKHALEPNVEAALAQFSQAFDGPYMTYQMMKMADMSFETVGDNVPLSFVLFENEVEYSADHALRREAYESFYGTLDKYKNGMAANYANHLRMQKAESVLKGFDTLTDQYLFDQEVSRDMYDRQIDLIMEKLAPAMRKYARLLKEIHGLDTMTFADLKLSVDDEFEPNITIEAAKEQLCEGLAVLGDDYLTMIRTAFDDRWIDFPQNAGKSTGAYCSSPYGVHPYVLISWTHRMRELFVLAHELGHAGHFVNATSHQNIFDARSSLYFIEAPSTMNEMLLAQHLLKKSEQGPRYRRWVLSTMISRTYYHNFVTHLLEAAYERKVLAALEAGSSLSSQELTDMMLSVYREFWGDAVEIPDYAGLTWMRQPHYYMNLYPYTYSAGLTISTTASEMVANGSLDINTWLDVLKAGGSKSPLDLALMAGIDLCTEQPLLTTIQKITDIIDEIDALTASL